MDKYSLFLIPCVIPGTQVATPFTSRKTKAKRNGDVYTGVTH